MDDTFTFWRAISEIIRVKTPILIKIFNDPRPQQWKTMASNKIFRRQDTFGATCKGHANPWLYSFLG
jgi:hypothetical protein